MDFPNSNTKGISDCHRDHDEQEREPERPTDNDSGWLAVCKGVKLVSLRVVPFMVFHEGLWVRDAEDAEITGVPEVDLGWACLCHGGLLSFEPCGIICFVVHKQFDLDFREAGELLPD